MPASDRKAVALFSGGLDSTTAAAMAMADGFVVHGLTVAYGQRHDAEIEAAQRIATDMGLVDHRVLDLDLRAIGGSALTDAAIDVPESPGQGVPVTYVPARNTVLLSLALGLAEVIEAADIFIGVNAVDYSGYPDCRPEFIKAFEAMANTATRASAEQGMQFRIHAPLLRLSKAEIIRKGMELGVDYAATVSCYQADDKGRACGKCDACRLRRQGFEDAGVPDPTRYA